MAIIHCLVVVFLCATPVMGRVIVFHTNCTRPASGSTANFVTAANTRGTLEILWSSIFTLIICTWTVQHLTVPPQYMSSVDRLRRKVRWMLISVVIPEYLVGLAVGDFVSARASLRAMQETISEGPELVEQGFWSMTHAFYANMGGFVLREMIVAEPAMPENESEAGGSNELNTSRVAATNRSGVTFSPICALDSTHIISCLKSGLLAPSFISKAEIRDKSKGDFFLKLTAAFQLLWLIVQVCARHAQKLSTSQLEIAVLAFCVCAFVCYLLWFKKPQDVGAPIFLDAARPINDSDRETLGEPTGFNLAFSNGTIRADAIIFKGHGEVSRSFDITMVDIGFVVGGTVFGALHLLAWNLYFPTHTEKILWRASSLLTTAFFPIWYCLYYGGDFVVYLLARKWKTFAIFLEDHLRCYGYSDNASVWLGMVGLVVYGICRLFIMVEVFRSLGFLPAEAFVGTWSTYVPHV